MRPFVDTNIVVYALSGYGGIRSPDSEVVFRTAQALAERGAFGLEARGDVLDRCGTAPGLDGLRHSIYGPGEALLAAPVVGVARRVVDAGWLDWLALRVPLSHYASPGSHPLAPGTARPVDPRPHLVRFLTSFLTPALAAAAVFAFCLALSRVYRDARVALVGGALLAFCTLLWPYAGTFFSEPGAALFVTLSLCLLLGGDALGDRARPSCWVWPVPWRGCCGSTARALATRSRPDGRSGTRPVSAVTAIGSRRGAGSTACC